MRFVSATKLIMQSSTSVPENGQLLRYEYMDKTLDCFRISHGPFVSYLLPLYNYIDIKTGRLRVLFLFLLTHLLHNHNGEQSPARLVYTNDVTLTLN
jgi:hypothetical protein